MTEQTEVLIIGAGPTGLAAALFLADRGHRARIIEKKEVRSPYSKAFGVNARSLQLLSDSGVTRKFLANGRKLELLTLRRNERALATLRLDHVKHPYPFMLVQSQADSERILEEALADRGIRVERGTEAINSRREGRQGFIDVVCGSDHKTLAATCVLASDGSRSSVREALGISFDGEAYDEPWSLYDVELKVSLPPDEASVLILDDGGMFLVRQKENLWRILGNVKRMLDRLPSNTEIGKIHWESTFEISNKVAERFADPPFYLAGDAAHVHAGIGARGMNLGIEDAYVFAELFDKGNLDRYDQLRRPAVKKVVSQIKRAMGPPRASTIPGKIIRKLSWLVPAAVSVIREPAQRWILGLDHDLGL